MLGASIRRWLVPAAVFAGTLAVYLSWPVLSGEPSQGTGDTISTKLVPISILTRGSLNLDQFPEFDQRDSLPYWVVRVGEHVWSKFPIGVPLLLVPFYVIAGALGFGVFQDRLVDHWAANIAAASFCAAAVMLVYLAYAPKGRLRALVAAAALGIGSSVWPLASQDAWQHGFGVAFAAWIVLLLERGLDDRRWLGWIGLACGFLFLVRPGNGPIVAVLAAYVLRRSRPEAVRFAAMGLPFLAVTVAYNLASFGGLFGCYGAEAARVWPWPTLLEGIPGLLVSPGRGLFVHSPWALLGGGVFLRNSEGRTTLRLLYAALIAAQLVLYGSYPGWYGGHCYGPRFLIEILPFCVALFWDALPAFSGIVGRTAVALALAWSIALAGTGYFVPWSQWNNHPDVDQCPGRFWDWRDSPWASVWFGLPDRCTHPYSAGPDEAQTYGAGIAYGAGWSFDDDRRVALAEAVLLVRPHGQPVCQLQLSLRPEPGLDGPQEVEATVGDRKTTVRLEPATSTLLAIPLVGAESQDEIAVTLRFSQAKRRSWSDIRRVAARIEGLRFGFFRTPSPATVPAIPVSR